VIAAAIADRQVTPLQFTSAKIMDPTIRAQLARSRSSPTRRSRRCSGAAAGPGGDRDPRRPPARQAARLPKGDPRNPLTDAEIAAKFAALAEGIATTEDVGRMQAAIAHVEDFDSARELMGELVVQR